MKLGQLIKVCVKNSFLKNNAENEVVRLVPDLVFPFQKTLYKIKTSGQHLSFKIFWQSST